MQNVATLPHRPLPRAASPSSSSSSSSISLSCLLSLEATDSACRMPNLSAEAAAEAAAEEEEDDLGDLEEKVRYSQR